MNTLKFLGDETFMVYGPLDIHVNYIYMLHIMLSNKYLGSIYMNIAEYHV